MDRPEKQQQILVDTIKREQVGCNELTQDQKQPDLNLVKRVFRDGQLRHAYRRVN